MADMIGADEAKRILGCDDATLNNHVNSGSIRAQRVAGQLRCNREDVEALAGGARADSDDGTIILSGDSEDLSIDLGEVVDDTAATLVHTRDTDQTGSITFGDDLEVVSFDEGNTQELAFDDGDATQNLSFTGEQTVVMTDVDETAVSATATATSDFQTVDYDDDGDAAASVSSRRSVRSQRVRRVAPKTHWIWPSLLVVNTLLIAGFVIPYFPMMIMPRADEFDTAGNVLRGVDDNGWTDMASAIAGFSVEPDEAKFRRSRPGDAVWTPISNDPTQVNIWRYQQYLGSRLLGLHKDNTAAAYDARYQALRIRHITTSDVNNVSTPTNAEARNDLGEVLATYTVQPTSTPLTGTGDGSAAEPVLRFEPLLRYDAGR